MDNLISKLSYSTLLLLFLLAISCKSNIDASDRNKNIFKQKHPEFSSKFEEQVKKIFEEKELEGDFLFAIVDEEGLLYSFALDKESLTGGPSPLGNSSPIYIASATKSFTGTLLKILEEQGKLDLNSSLANYLPDLDFNDSIDTEEINIRSLLNHTSGFYSTSLTWKTAFLGYSGQNSELINDLNTDFLHDPSRVFRYSNVGPIVAGIVVEKITGNSWKEEMREHIFQPLKMLNTSANVSDFDFKKIRPSVTVSGENGIVATGFYKKDITMHASGGIISTINDLSKWLSVNIRQGEKLLTKDSWADLHTSTTIQDRNYFTYQRTGYSLGWDVAEYQGNTILTRFGNLAGLSFHISFMPGEKIGVIAFSSDNRAYLLPHLMANYAYNQINSNSADSILEIEKLKFKEAFKKENEIIYPQPSQRLINNTINDKILGTYQSISTWPTIFVVEEGNSYIFKWGVLHGEIYETQEGYTSSLGVMNRAFTIENDTLKTGSLIYIRKNSLEHDTMHGKNGR